MNLLFLNEKIKFLILGWVGLLLAPAAGLSAPLTERDLSIGAIPVRLLENANTVIRYYDATLEVRSVSSAVMKYSFAISIVREAGIKEANLMLLYDKFRTYRKLKGAVYDRNGQRAEKMKLEDFKDLSAIQGYSTYEDNRVIICRPGYQTVPYTVEYSFELEFHGIFNLQDFTPMTGYNMSLEQAMLSITSPDAVGVRYMEQQIREKANKKNENGITTYTWDFKNYPAIRQEPLSPPFGSICPMVFIAPGSFELKNRVGNADSWESLGKWIYSLIQDRDQLSDETTAKIRALVASATNDREKIGLIYQYLQDHTRYVSIQVGLGGWQPEKASEVDRLGYGDCKALTNYMRALLKAAGIYSCYTVVYAGKDKPDIISAFPSNQFNHVILCVPMKTDSVWLECTSQHAVAGYLGSFTDDRSVLLLREEGGSLCHTPVYDQQVSNQRRTTEVHFTESKDALVTSTTVNRGFFYDETLPVLLADRENQRREITNRIHLHSFNLEKFSLTEQRTAIPAITETIELTMNQALTQVGEGYLFAPSLYVREYQSENTMLNRVHPVVIRRAMETSDTIRFKIPAGFSVSGVPFEENFNSRFGSYHASAAITGNMLQYVRTLTTKKGSWEPDEYEDCVSFFEKIATADGRKLALKQ